MSEDFEGAFPFLASEQAVVNENTGQLVSDCAVDEGGNYRRINSPREGGNNLAAANLFADMVDAFIYKIAGCPFALTAANAIYKIFQ